MKVTKFITVLKSFMNKIMFMWTITKMWDVTYFKLNSKQSLLITSYFRKVFNITCIDINTILFITILPKRCALNENNCQNYKSFKLSVK